MATNLATRFAAPLIASTVSRLLVDLNRSVGHKDLHTKAIRALPSGLRQGVIESCYQPYRREAERLVALGIAQQGRVIHISCHSFTNCLDGVIRHADIGLLYDPGRQQERNFCAHWKSALKALAPQLEVRRNFPYQGRNDGLTSALRVKFPPDVYLGIELELNQKNLSDSEGQWAALRESVINSLCSALGGHGHGAGIST